MGLELGEATSQAIMEVNRVATRQLCLLLLQGSRYLLEPMLCWEHKEEIPSLCWLKDARVFQQKGFSSTACK